MTGSMFHEIVAIPSLMPEAAHPYKLPGVQPGTSVLDDIPWACPYLQSMHEVLCTEQDGKSVTSPSPLATGLPPLSANNTSPTPKPQQSQQSPVDDPSGVIFFMFVRPWNWFVIRPTFPPDCNQDISWEAYYGKGDHQVQVVYSSL